MRVIWLARLIGQVEVAVGNTISLCRLHSGATAPTRDLRDESTLRSARLHPHALFANHSCRVGRGMGFSRWSDKLACSGADAQRGAAGDSRVCAVPRRDQRDFEAAGIDAPSGQAGSNLTEKRIQHGRDAATHDHDIGF
jgi:hypothetical protein